MRSKGRGAAATSWIRDTRKRSLGYKAHAPYHPADRETRTAWWSKNKAYTPYDRPSSPGERWNDPGVRRTRLIPSSLPRKPRQLARDAPSAHRKRTAPQKQVVRCTHHTLAGTQQHRQPPMHFLCARSASAGKRDRRSVSCRRYLGTVQLKRRHEWTLGRAQLPRGRPITRALLACTAVASRCHSSRPQRQVDDDGKSVAQCTRHVLLSAAFMLLKAG